MSVRLPPSVQTLGAALRWARTRAQLSMRTFAARLDVSAPFINDVEHDRRSMRRVLVEKAAEVLGVDAIDLLSRTRQSSRSLNEFIDGHPNLRQTIAELMRNCRCEWCLQWEIEQSPPATPEAAPKA